MKITREKANRLKDKFYAATATPEEERLLARLLRSGEYPEEWADERRALLALLPEENKALPEGFALRLAERLEQERATTHRPIRLQWRRWSAAAMLVLALGGTAFWYVMLPTPDEPVLVKQREKPLPPKTAPAASAAAPVLAETALPQAEKEKTPVPTNAKPHPRPKTKTAMTAKSTPPVAAIASAAELQTPPSTSDISALSANSLNSHLQRTLQSRDRLIAEARTYMAASCLNRSIPPQKDSNTEAEK